MKASIFLTSLVLLQPVISQAKGLYGLGCGILNNNLVTVGGIEDQKTMKLTDQSYSLNLNSISQSYLEQSIYQPNISISYTNLLNLGFNKLLLIGGKNIRLDKGSLLFTYNNQSTTDSNKYNKQSLEGPKDVLRLPDSNQTLNFYPQAGRLVNLDSTNLNFYLFSMLYLTNDQATYIYNPTITKYNLMLNSWESVKVKGDFPNVMDFTAHTYKDNVYLVGGGSSNPNQVENLKSLQPINQIYKFNIKESSFSTVNLKGLEGSNLNSEGRHKHTSVLVKGYIYVVGGRSSLDSSDANTDNKLLIIDLDNLTIQVIDRPGFKSSLDGCLVNYKDQLVYSFGIFKNNDLSLKPTQFIALEGYSLQQSALPPLPTGTLIAIVVSTVVGFILLCLAGYFGYKYYKKVQERKEKERMDHNKRMSEHDEYMSKLKQAYDQDNIVDVGSIDNNLDLNATNGLTKEFDITEADRVNIDNTINVKY